MNEQRVSSSGALRDAIADAYEAHRSRSGGWTRYPKPGFDVTCMCGEKWSDPTVPYPDGEGAEAINRAHDLHRAEVVLGVVAAHLDQHRDAAIEAGARWFYENLLPFTASNTSWDELDPRSVAKMGCRSKAEGFTDAAFGVVFPREDDK